jgi:hypothetical protein
MVKPIVKYSTLFIVKTTANKILARKSQEKVFSNILGIHAIAKNLKIQDTKYVFI